MSLKPGFNLVTQMEEETDADYGALEFLRVIRNNAEIPGRVTVTGIDNLLYNAEAEDRADVIGIVRRTLRESKSIDQFTAVQFLIDGQFSSADRFQIRIERRGNAEIIDIGELFVGEPERISPTHAVTPK